MKKSTRKTCTYKRKGGYKYEKTKGKSNRKSSSIVLKHKPRTYTYSKGRTRRIISI